MKSAYRLAWEEVPRAWVAVAATLFLPLPAWALPSGAVVSYGNVAMQQSGSRLNINQSSNRAIVNWHSFSIGNGELVNLAQPSSSAAMLARVTGSLPSSINGQLQANGHLYLINRNGIVVGPQGRINTNGFVASTRDVTDSAFLSGGPMTFQGDGLGVVTNLGVIQAGGGNVVLLGHQVSNAGTISAPNGSASLVAADELFLASPDSPDLLVLAGTRTPTHGTAVDNSGLVSAAQARLEAASGNLYQLAVNQSGVVQATGVNTQGGHILLTAEGGTVQDSGSLRAVNADGSGGEIQVGGDFHGQGSVAHAQNTVVTATAVIDASAATQGASGGKVAVWSDSKTDFSGTIHAGTPIGAGGTVEVSGKHDLHVADSAVIDANGLGGKGGSILLDPDQITIASGGTATSLSGSGAVTMDASTLQNLLGGGNVTLDTSTYNYVYGTGEITFNQDVSWTSANTLSLYSGNGIKLNGNITAANGTLALYTGKDGIFNESVPTPTVDTGIYLATGTTMQAGTVQVGINAAANPAGNYTFAAVQTASLTANGNIVANTLNLDLSNGKAGMIALGSNQIGTIQTVGTGNLDVLHVQNTSGNLNVKLTAASTNYIELSTPGNLTLQAGSSLAAAAQTDVILASTGGNFINQAGGSVFGANLRYLIYTGTTAGTVKDGLTGTDEFSRTYTANPPSNYSADTTSRFLYSSPGTSPQLTYTADSLTKIYGDANPNLTYTVTGFQSSFTNDVTGTPSLVTTAGITSGVNTYAISIARGSLASTNYTFNFVPGTLTINRAPLTLDVNNASRYFGQSNPTFSATVSGLKANDTASAILSAFTLGSSASASSNVGSYAVTASTTSTVNQNYTYTINNGTLTVNATPVTVSLPATSKIYGDANPNFLADAVLTGAYNGDTVATAFSGASFTTAATTASSVGTYPVTAGGLSNPNYVVTVGGIGDLTINKASLVVNANNASRIYGDPDPAFSVASVSGLKSTDTLSSLSGLTLTSNTTGSSVVGTYPIVPAGTLQNYNLVAGTGTLTVNKASVAVHLNPASRYYGDTDPTFTATYVGLKNGETSLPGLSPVSNTNMYTPVGTNYVISAGGTTTFQNYLPTFYAAVLTIDPRPLTVTANDAQRTYGAVNPALGVTVTNATSWDAAQAANYWVASTFATDHSNAGSYPITASANPYGNPFNNLANYVVTLKPGTLTVNRAPLTIAVNPVSIQWGDALPQLTYTVQSGLMPWDSGIDTSGVALSSQAAGSPPGQYPITVSQANVGANYTAVLSAPGSVNVAKRLIYITGNYTATNDGVGNIYPGTIEPYNQVTSYGANGAPSGWIMHTDPLPGGPQFTVATTSDGTSGSSLMTDVTNSFVQPAAGYTQADVLTYYEPVSKPGVANIVLPNNKIYTGQVTTPLTVNVQKPNTQVTADTTPYGAVPAIGNMLKDVFPAGSNSMGTSIKNFLKSPGASLMNSASRQLLVDAQADESTWQWYKNNVDSDKAYIAKLESEKPSGWQTQVASAQADIATWQADMAKTPSLENLRAAAIAGDPTAVKAIAPIMAMSMMAGLKDGTLNPSVAAAMLKSINDNRAKLVKAADAKYNAAIKDAQSTGMVQLFSSPKIPDIVGQAYVDVAAEQHAKTEMAGTIGAALGSGGVIAGSMIGMATLVGGVQGSVSSSVTVLTEMGAGTAVAGPAIIATAAAAIGIAEAVETVQSTKNYDRYVAFKKDNQQLTSLKGLDLNNKNNLGGAMLAIQSLIVQSFEGGAQ